MKNVPPEGDRVPFEAFFHAKKEKEKKKEKKGLI